MNKEVINTLQFVCKAKDCDNHATAGSFCADCAKGFTHYVEVELVGMDLRWTGNLNNLNYYITMAIDTAKLRGIMNPRIMVWESVSRKVPPYKSYRRRIKMNKEGIDTLLLACKAKDCHNHATTGSFCAECAKGFTHYVEVELVGMDLRWAGNLNNLNYYITRAIDTAKLHGIMKPEIMVWKSESRKKPPFESYRIY